MFCSPWEETGHSLGGSWALLVSVTPHDCSSFIPRLHQTASRVSCGDIEARTSSTLGFPPGLRFQLFTVSVGGPERTVRVGVLQPGGSPGRTEREAPRPAGYPLLSTPVPGRAWKAEAVPGSPVSLGSPAPKVPCSAGPCGTKRGPSARKGVRVQTAHCDSFIMKRSSYMKASSTKSVTYYHVLNNFCS